MSTISEKGTIDSIGRALGYELDYTKKIKNDYEKNDETAKEKYKELFYYFDGLLGTYIAQSRHPAGIVASPIELNSYATLYSKSDEDNKNLITLQLDMDCVHECGLVKYDILGLKNIGILKKTCEYIGIPYPKSHEVNWEDEKVWKHMKVSPIGIFQMEKASTFNVLKNFNTSSIGDMSLVTAVIRPACDSFRDQFVQKIPNKNPSEIIDNLLKDNYGYLVYQEDTLRFLIEICGFSGSHADNVRRAIGRKDYERLKPELPQIMEGYCSKSDKEREIAEEEAKQFLQIIEDSAAYQFNYSHSVGYCMIGYLCAYFRYYYPMEFLMAFFNCTKQEDDFVNGTQLANVLGITIKEPRFRYSRSDYFADKETNILYKGMESVKFLNKKCSNDLYKLRNNKYDTFTDLLYDIKSKVSINTRQMEILIKLDFFEEFGNSLELYNIYCNFQNFKEGEAKSYNKSLLTNEILYNIIKRNSDEKDKTFQNMNTRAILLELEEMIRASKLDDFSYQDKIKTQLDFLGYVNLHTGRNQDRSKIIVLSKRVFKSTFGDNAGKPWCVSIEAQSIGSNIKNKFTVLYSKYEKNKFNELDIINVKKFHKNKKGYWYIDEYEIIV